MVNVGISPNESAGAIVSGGMTFLRTVAAGATLCALTSVGASAQTADDVIERHLTATGGRAALAKLESRHAVGTVSVSTPVGELTGPVEVFQKIPNKTRTLVTLDLSSLGAGRMTSDQRFDGTVAYVLDSLQGNREVTGAQLEVLRNGVFPTPLLSYKERGAAATLTGREKVGDREAFVIQFTPKSGPQTRGWIDAESYLLLKTALSVHVAELGQEIEQVTEFLDYRDVDGVKVPFIVKTTNPVQRSTSTVTKVSHNVPIDDAVFVKPAQ